MTNLEIVISTIDRLIFEKKVKSRRDLAEKLGYTESSLSQILNGKVALSDKFIKILSNFDSSNNAVLSQKDCDAPLPKEDRLTAIIESQQRIIEMQAETIKNLTIK